MMWAILIVIVIATVLHGIWWWAGVMMICTSINDLDRHLTDRLLDANAFPERRWPQ